VNVNGKVYEIENERDFVRLVKELYPNFVEKLIETAKREL
jgi:phospholipid N-methyltransferase